MRSLLEWKDRKHRGVKLMVRTKIIYNGVDLEKYGVIASGTGVFQAPERDMEKVSVPGRNGDLILDNGRYLNLDVTYHIGIQRPVDTNLRGLRSALLSQPGYHRLEDSWHTNEFRLAAFKGPIQPDVKVMLRVAEFDLTFDCKPQRFIKSGEHPIEFTSNGIIFNLYDMTAKPLVRVYGTGYLTIGAETIRIMTANEYTDIDCELMDAYKDGTNCNRNIQLQTGEFFHLDPGDNNVVITGDITRVIIIPRWWIL